MTEVIQRFLLKNTGWLQHVVNNKLAVCNTVLLRTYSEVDPRFRQVETTILLLYSDTILLRLYLLLLYQIVHL